VDGPDNITVSPRGGIVLCEDDDSNPKRLIGLTPDGEPFTFAQNLIDLKPGDIDTIDAAFPGTKANFWDNPVGTYTSREWAEATFQGGYSTTYVPFCGLAVIEALAGERTEVTDPFGEWYANLGGQDLQPHQADLYTRTMSQWRRLSWMTHGA
jgi:hypothetical protein